MNRLVLAACGWLILSIVTLVLLYDTANFLQMPSYEASALVRLSTDEANQKAERILVYGRPSFVLSTNVLYPACNSVDLAKKWSSRYLSESSLLTEKEVYSLLQRLISVGYPKNESEPVRITIFDEKPDEAIEIANAAAVSLQYQLSRLNDGARSSHNVRVQNAINARRVRPWLTFLVKAFVVVSFGLAAVVLIRVSRLMPPPVPMPRQQDTGNFSKY